MQRKLTRGMIEPFIKRMEKGELPLFRIRTVDNDRYVGRIKSLEIEESTGHIISLVINPVDIRIQRTEKIENARPLDSTSLEFKSNPLRVVQLNKEQKKYPMAIRIRVKAQANKYEFVLLYYEDGPREQNG